MERYGNHCEQSYRTNYNRSWAMCINWGKLWALDFLPVVQSVMRPATGTPIC